MKRATGDLFASMTVLASAPFTVFARIGASFTREHSRMCELLCGGEGGEGVPSEGCKLLDFRLIKVSLRFLLALSVPLREGGLQAPLSWYRYIIYRARARREKISVVSCWS